MSSGDTRSRQVGSRRGEVRAYRRRPPTVADELIEANTSCQKGFEGPWPLRPARKVAVIACMDARLDPAKIGAIDEV